MGNDLSHLLSDPRALSTLALLFSPILITQALRSLSALRRPPPASRLPRARTRHPKLYSSLLVAHSLSILLVLLLGRPPNLLAHLPTPLAPLPPSLPPHLAPPLLHKRLQSFPLRTLYIRYGHPSLTLCTWCADSADFGLYWLAGAGVQYVLEGVVLGALLAGWTGRKRGRPMGLLLLGGAGAGEWYVLQNVPIDLSSPSPPIMWHDVLLLSRLALFLALPLLSTLLPPSPPPRARLLPLLTQLDSLLPHLTFLRLQRAAVARSPELRTALLHEWERRGAEEGAVWADEQFRATARGAHMPLEAGTGFMSEVRNVTQRLWAGTGFLPPVLPRMPDGTAAVDADPPVPATSIQE